jgi:hypothetical protein
VELNGPTVTPEDVIAGARADAAVTLGARARTAMEASAAVIERLAAGEEPVYGVSTGFGSLANVRIPADRRDELQRALLTWRRLVDRFDCPVLAEGNTFRRRPGFALPALSELIVELPPRSAAAG